MAFSGLILRSSPVQYKLNKTKVNPYTCTLSNSVNKSDYVDPGAVYLCGNVGQFPSALLHLSYPSERQQAITPNLKPDQIDLDRNLTV